MADDWGQSAPTTEEAPNYVLPQSLKGPAILDYKDPTMEGQARALHALEIRRVCALAESVLRDEAWVRNLPPSYDGDALNGLTIAVAEEPCKIARGVPFETVFTITLAGCAKRYAKILKAVVDVPAEDVVGMVRTQLATDDAPDLHHIHSYMEGMERAVATPYVPDDEPVEAPTYMTETGATLPNPDAEEHYLIDMVCDPASLPGPIRRALMLQGKT